MRLFKGSRHDALVRSGHAVRSIRTLSELSRINAMYLCIKVAGNHVNEIHDFRKKLNLSRLGCLCRRRFAMRFACLPIDIEHGKF